MSESTDKTPEQHIIENHEYHRILGTNVGIGVGPGGALNLSNTPHTHLDTDGYFDIGTTGPCLELHIAVGNDGNTFLSAEKR